MDNYIIYEVLYKKRVVYIGSGRPEREKHVTSGASHNADLNKLFFTDPDNIQVNVIRTDLSKEESLLMEKEYIQAVEPQFNKAHTSRVRKNKRRKHLDY